MQPCPAFPSGDPPPWRPFPLPVGADPSGPRRLVDNRDVRGGSSRQVAAQPRISLYFHADCVGFEARFHVEAQGRGMVVGAGVDPHPVDGPRPGQFYRLAHQRTADTPARAVRGEPQERQLAFPLRAEVQLQNANVPKSGPDNVDVDVGVREDGGQLAVFHEKARKPQPVGPDLAEQRAVGIQADFGNRGQLETLGQGSAGQVGPGQHFEVGDDTGNVSAGNGGVADGNGRRGGGHSLLVQ